MPRPKEDRTKIQCRMLTDKKNKLDKLLLDAGFCRMIGNSVYPLYAEFLEGLMDKDSRALKIIFDLMLDNLE